MTKYFADTYALIEIIEGNPNYKRFLKDELITSVFNLYELYYRILSKSNEQIAKKYFYYFKNNVSILNDELIFQASEIKLKYKKKRLSYTDCIGYVTSNTLRIKFLTGDKEFEDIPNVEFIK
jgi:predicted nucleic acid-binding protein